MAWSKSLTGSPQTQDSILASISTIASRIDNCDAGLAGDLQLDSLDVTTATITSSTINSSVIGGITPAAGTFTTLTGSTITGTTFVGVSGLVEIGSIIMYGGLTAPTGWLLCDGTSYSTSGAYSDLFKAIGPSFGSADGTHFNVPDFRGIFPRGTDNSALNDLDAASRTAAKTGGNTGASADRTGSYQADAFKAHTHGMVVGNNDDTGEINEGQTSSSVVHQTQSAGDSNNETRPKNLYVNFIIRYA